MVTIAQKGKEKGLKEKETQVNKGRVQDICDSLTQVKEGRVKGICKLLTQVNKGRVQVRVVAWVNKDRVHTTTSKTSSKSWKVLKRINQVFQQRKTDGETEKISFSSRNRS